MGINLRWHNARGLNCMLGHVRQISLHEISSQNSYSRILLYINIGLESDSHESWLNLHWQALWSTRNRPGGQNSHCWVLSTDIICISVSLTLDGLLSGPVGWLPFGTWSSEGKLLESSLLSKPALPGFASEVISQSKLKHYNRWVSSASTILLKQLNVSIIITVLWAVWTFHSFLCSLQGQLESCSKLIQMNPDL